MDAGPLQKQQVLLSAEPSLQSQGFLIRTDAQKIIFILSFPSLRLFFRGTKTESLGLNSKISYIQGEEKDFTTQLTAYQSST